MRLLRLRETRLQLLANPVDVGSRRPQRRLGLFLNFRAYLTGASLGFLLGGARELLHEPIEHGGLIGMRERLLEGARPRLHRRSERLQLGLRRLREGVNERPRLLARLFLKAHGGSYIDTSK